MQKSRVAHSIKDLEKALPSVASVNGMHVKDYLQSLSDDNKIHVEKIGSGNWYWSFAGDAKRSGEVEIERVRAERDGLAAHVGALRGKVEDACAAREDDGDGDGDSDGDKDKEDGDGDGVVVEEEGKGKGKEEKGSRRALLERVELLEKEAVALRAELAACCECDPVELRVREGRVRELREEAMRWTDQILGLESWLRRQMGGDRERLQMVQRVCYGDEFDEGEGGLCEIFA